MKTIPFVWSNDDVTFGQADKMRRQLEFLAEMDVPGTFFVVPQRSIGTIDQDNELMELLLSARSQGHELHQHGMQHDPFECGVPETWMMAFSPAVAARFDTDRLELEKLHTVEALTDVIGQGREIWRRAFGEDSTGFRPGWGAFCGNLYRALAQLGFSWTSSRIVNLTSWLWCQGQWDRDVAFRENMTPTPYPVLDTGVWEIPMSGGEYAFGVPDDSSRMDMMVKLALREFDWCYEKQIPFIMVSHWHGLEKNNASGYRVHRTFLDQVRETGKAEFMTLNECFENWR